MLAASNIHYEMADRSRGIACGGIGAIHLLARRTGLVEAIDRRLHLLKVHLPYHESDHVLNIAYNILAGGTCLEDIEQHRNQEAFLDALGADRIPDPTTAGDFCRRFESGDIETLMDSINQVRLNVWKQQPEEFFEQAVIDADGTLATTYRARSCGRAGGSCTGCCRGTRGWRCCGAGWRRCGGHGRGRPPARCGVSRRPGYRATDAPIRMDPQQVVEGK